MPRALGAQVVATKTKLRPPRTTAKTVELESTAIKLNRALKLTHAKIVPLVVGRLSLVMVLPPEMRAPRVIRANTMM